MSDPTFPPMTRADLALALHNALVEWTVPGIARALIIRLVSEIYRLRHRAALHRQELRHLDVKLAIAEDSRPVISWEDRDAALEAANDLRTDLPNVADLLLRLAGLEPAPAVGAEDQPEPVKRIDNAEDFIEALGDAIEGGEFTGVLGIDDEGDRGDGARVFTLLLNNADETKIPLTVGSNRLALGEQLELLDGCLPGAGDARVAFDALRKRMEVTPPRG